VAPDDYRGLTESEALRRCSLDNSDLLPGIGRKDIAVIALERVREPMLRLPLFAS
jgi:hypothetical protein